MLNLYAAMAAGSTPCTHMLPVLGGRALAPLDSRSIKPKNTKYVRYRECEYDCDRIACLSHLHST